MNIPKGQLQIFVTPIVIIRYLDGMIKKEK